MEYSLGVKVTPEFESVLNEISDTMVFYLNLLGWQSNLLYR
ncbi:hypothetical protein EW15_1302 [Prochlorococcus sp. MIT 0801]|nr:hypothetical protein EW15_1302 [Prochlorococcus sp. MIT 0801]